MKKIKNPIYVFFVCLIVLFSCKDDRIEKRKEKIESEYSSLENLGTDNSIVSKIDEHLYFKNGAMVFASQESFDIITKHVLSSDLGKKEFRAFSDKNNFKSLYNFYEYFPEEKILEFIKNRQIPTNYSSYYVFTKDNDGELTLEKNVVSTFLRLYFSEDMYFYIGNEKIIMEGNQLFKYNDKVKTELTSKII